MHVEDRYLATRRRGHLGDFFPPTVAQCPRRWRLPGRCLARPAGSSTRRLWCAAHTRPGGGCPTSTHHLCSRSAVLPPHRPAEPLPATRLPPGDNSDTPGGTSPPPGPGSTKFPDGGHPRVPVATSGPARRIYPGPRAPPRALVAPGGIYPAARPPPGGACRSVPRWRRLPGRCFARPVGRGFALQTIRVRHF